MKARALRQAPLLDRLQAPQQRAETWRWQGAQHCKRLRLAPKMCCVCARAALRAKRLLSACVAAQSQEAARSQEMYQGVSAVTPQWGCPHCPPGPAVVLSRTAHGRTQQMAL